MSPPARTGSPTRPPAPATLVDLRPQLRMLLTDRHSGAARELFASLVGYTERRVAIVSRHCGNTLAESERDEVVGEVLLQLMSGSLASFRGETLPELLGFVRTIADRTTWRAIRRRDRERSLLQADGDLVEEWNASLPRPDAHIEVAPQSPLPESDQRYLLELLKAGSKAELARRAGVSRAAVTQRVQRIRNRVAELPAGERMAHEVWLQLAARRTVETEILVEG